MEKRRVLYENAADIRIDVDGKSVLEVCHEIIRKIG